MASTTTRRRRAALRVDPEIAVEQLTPEFARDVLTDHNPRNRRLIHSRVVMLAKAIEGGEWLLNGESVKFDRNGNLIDGQHRLAAVIEANRAVESVIVRNLPTETQDTVDIGAKRHVGDILALHGYRSDPNYMASTARMLWQYENGVIGLRGGGRATSMKNNKATMQELVDFALKNDFVILEGVGYARQVRLSIPVSRTAISTAYCIFHGIDAVQARTFMTYLATGENQHGGSPILHLRNRFIKEATQPRKLGSIAQLAYTIKAWNFWREDTTINLLHWKGLEIEGMPSAV